MSTLGYFARVVGTTEIYLVVVADGSEAWLRDDLENHLAVKTAALEPVGAAEAFAHFEACDRVHQPGDPSAVAAAMTIIQHKEAA